MRLIGGEKGSPARTARGPAQVAAAERATMRLVWGGVGLVVLAAFALIALTLYRPLTTGPETGNIRAARVRTAAVIAAANHLELAIENAERAQRAYLLTASGTYFDAYRRSAERALASLGRLRKLTAAAPQQQRPVALLGHEVRLQLAKLAQTAQLRRAAGLNAARTIIDKEAGFDPVEIVVGIVANLVRRETAALNEAEIRRAAALARRAEQDQLAGGAIAGTMLLGSGLMVLGFCRHRRQQRQGREGDERYRLLVEDLADMAIVTLDADGRVIGWNRGAEQITGFSQGEMLGREFARCYPAEAQAAGFPTRQLAEARDSGRVAFEGWRVCADGSQFWADTVITTLSGEGGRLRGLVDITRDTTERRRRSVAEVVRRQRRARAQRMAALGRFAAEAAAEFEAVLGPGWHQRAGIAADWRAIGQQQELVPQDVDIGALVERLVEEWRQMPGSAIAVESSAEPGLWPVCIDPGRLTEALRLSAKAATAALPAGEVLALGAGNAYLDDADPAGPGPGRYVLVTLAGRATSLSTGWFEAALTPSAAAGAGFGLSGAYGFLRQSGGDIRFLASPEQDGKMGLLLSAAGGGIGAPLPILSRGRETVLVAEADPQMRGFNATSLAAVGYRPLEAAEGAAALRLLEHHREIAVVVAGLSLPGLCPRAFAAAARQRSHHVKLLFSGDCVGLAGLDRRIFPPGVDLLAKPFTAGMLEHAVRRLLRES